MAQILTICTVWDKVGFEKSHGNRNFGFDLWLWFGFLKTKPKFSFRTSLKSNVSLSTGWHLRKDFPICLIESAVLADFFVWIFLQWFRQHFNFAGKTVFNIALYSWRHVYWHVTFGTLIVSYAYTMYFIHYIHMYTCSWKCWYNAAADRERKCWFYSCAIIVHHMSDMRECIILFAVSKLLQLCCLHMWSRNKINSR